jgi:hypothetical protein
MLEIHPVSYVSLKNELHGIESKHPTIWNEIVYHEGADPDKRLFLQVGYDEIDGEELDQILGYMGIAQANNPIGLPCEFKAFTWRSASGNESLLFPLSGLYAHFRQVVPVIISDYEIYGSMDVFVDSKGCKMSAVEYLVTGTLECISFCNRNRFGLAFHW